MSMKHIERGKHVGWLKGKRASHSSRRLKCAIDGAHSVVANKFTQSHTVQKALRRLLEAGC